MLLQLSSIAILLFILLLNLAGLALAAHRLTGNYLLARTASPAALALAGFFAEHFVGLGDLAWLWPLTTAAATWMVWREWRILWANRIVEAVFHASFAYAMVWRFAFPNVDASSEKLTGLHFLRNYAEGGVLPPVDGWLPPFRADVYYSFQHYASALAGRILDWELGFSYNVTFALIVALTVTAATGAAFLLTSSRLCAVAAGAALLLGGNGATPVAPWVKESPALHTSMRFIGGSVTPAEVNRPLGRWLVRVNEVPEKEAVELPAESFAYMVSLGDHHPPMSGYLLLALGLLAIAAIEAKTGVIAAYAILAGTLPLTMVSNTWSLPLQALLAAAFIGHRALTRQRVEWAALLGGMLAATILISPFLRHFAARSLEYGTSFRLVPGGEHTPPLLGLIVFAPFLLLLLAHLFGGSRRCWWLWGLWVALLVFSEFIYVDDVYSGKFNRFNTTLKWWPWLMAGMTVTLGSLNLAAKSKWCRGLTMAAFAILLCYAAPLTAHLVRTPKAALGQLAGDAWIKSDPIEKPILEFLRMQPLSTVLQRVDAGAFTYAPGLAMHAGHRSVIGWPEHEKLWRARRSDIGQREEEMRAFYDGSMAEPAQWLLDHSVGYVLWLKGDNDRVDGAWERIQSGISGHYSWREFYAVGDFRVGFWSRKR